MDDEVVCLQMAGVTDLENRKKSPKIEGNAYGQSLKLEDPVFNMLQSLPRFFLRLRIFVWNPIPLSGHYFRDFELTA